VSKKWVADRKILENNSLAACSLCREMSRALEKEFKSDSNGRRCLKKKRG